MPFKFKPSFLLILLLFLFEISIIANEKSAIEPTDKETLMLEYTNRLRGNPKAEALRVVEILKNDKNAQSVFYKLYTGKGFQVKVDFDLFVKEVSETQPALPLAFNLKLLRASRNHSRYLIANNISSHFERPGGKGFTGIKLDDRCRKVGYAGRAYGENVGAKGGSVLLCYLGFLIDWGPPYGAGGMQPGRGHRVAMCSSIFKEIGIGIVDCQYSGKPDIAVVENFGTQLKGNIRNNSKKDIIKSIKGSFRGSLNSKAHSSRDRFIVGVIFKDHDEDKFYSIGEGVGGVVIKASDGSECVSWKSGAYTLKLKSRKPITVTMEHAGVIKEFEFGKGVGNQKADWIVVDKRVIRKQRHLLKQLGEKPNKFQLTKLFFHVRENNFVLNLDENESIKKAISSLSADLSSMFTDLDHLIKNRDMKKLKTQLMIYKRENISPELVVIYKETDVLRKGIEGYLSLALKRSKSSSAKYRRQLSTRAKRALRNIEKNQVKMTFKEYQPYWDQLVVDLNSAASKGSSK